MALSNPFKNLSKPQLYAVIGGSIIIGGIIEVKHHKSTGSWNPFGGSSSSSSASSSTSGSSTATSIDPVTGLAYSEDDMTDPITGLEYLAEAQEYGSVSAAEASVSAYGQSTATGSGVAVNPASPIASGSVNSVVGSTVYTSNAAWAQAVEAGLTDVGYSSTDIASAIGAYLTQQPVDSTEANIISVAIAEYGSPPVGNLQIITTPTSTSSSSTMVQVPDVLNQTAGNAHNAIVAAGLIPVDPNGGVSGEASWKVTSTSPTGGTSVASGSKVTINAVASVKVPNVVGQTAGTAHNTLTAAGLTPVDANANASGEPTKKVTSQDPAAGSDVAKGTKVSIIT